MVTPDQKAVPSISSVCIINRVHRLWKTAARQVPPRKRKRGGFKNQQRSVPQQTLYPVWSYDFVHDKCGGGAKLKMLCLSDEVASSQGSAMRSKWRPL